ncbi:hypothetical protein KVT40_007859 [Elsinoe batatas]|uniref:INO80 complex subunit F domain-containing protein n=1 Tax=Elsinoe batatas TaxID=2601811 RepID=A0A8K0KWF4_9PEZI|nr:hypothetical protein KVT40_007859 [Elsinoe batatas]
MTTPPISTPLPPSVEKAYYRKCIELKRRLNEVEEANDAARVRRLRLDRAILKMRLERAFLLEQLGRRMEVVEADGEGHGERERRGDRRGDGRGDGVHGVTGEGEGVGGRNGSLDQGTGVGGEEGGQGR